MYQLLAGAQNPLATGRGPKNGRVYEIRLDGLLSTIGDEVLHPEAYYTLNELVR